MDPNTLRHAIAQSIKNREINPPFDSFCQLYFASFLDHVIPYLEADRQPQALEDLYTYFLYTRQEILNPTTFDHFTPRTAHEKDFTSFCKRFMSHMIDTKSSLVEGVAHVEQIEQWITNNHNVILCANHQVEPDPQILQVLLDKTYFPKLPQSFASLGENILFVAGNRVLQDPMVTTGSKGLHILSIYSKTYLDTPPELRKEKIAHNKKSIRRLELELAQGGVCLYFAPSGGRDRKGEDGTLCPRPFTPSAIELFYLLAQKSHRPTHFIPLALKTHHLLPPPDQIQTQLGEIRQPQYGPAYVAFGAEVNLDISKEHHTKHDLRHMRSEKIYRAMLSLYQNLPSPP